MSETPASDANETDPPWQQELMDSEWLWALAAVLFFTLSYLVWGLIDILTVPTG